jgi:WD40 repeat protein
MVSSEPEMSILLALEAIKWASTKEAESILRKSLRQSRLHYILKSHKGPVVSVNFSPKGKFLVTASKDGNAILWDATTGIKIADLHGHAGPLYHASFSPAGDLIVTASADKTGRVWKIPTGTPVSLLNDHKDHVTTAEFFILDTNLRVVTASRDAKARIWNPVTGELIRTLPHRWQPLYIAAVSPDGKYMVTDGGVYHAWVWDSTNWKQVDMLNAQGVVLRHMSFSPDGHYLITASGEGSTGYGEGANPVRLWKVGTWQKINELKIHKKDVRHAEFSPNSYLVITASDDKTSAIWAPRGGREDPLILLYGHIAEVTDATFSPDGRWVVTGSKDRTARIWEATTGISRYQLRGHGGELNDVAFSPDGRLIATASEDHTVRLWDSGTGQAMLDIGRSKRAQFSPDSNLVGIDSTIMQISTGNTIVNLRGKLGSTRQAAFSSDGRYVVTVGPDNYARVWSTQNWNLVFQLKEQGKTVNRAGFSPDSQYIFTISSKRAKIWNSETGEHVSEFDLGKDYEYSKELTFSPDGSLILAQRSWQSVSIFETATGKELAVLKGHGSSYDGGIESASFSPQGRWITTAGRDKKVRFWNIQTGKVVSETQVHEDWVVAIDFNSDGTLLLTAGRDNLLKLWKIDDKANLTLVRELRGHSSYLESASFSNDDRWIISTSFIGAARVWSVETGQTFMILDGLKSGSFDGAEFSPDNNFILTTSVVGSINSQTQIYDVRECGSLTDIIFLAKSRINKYLSETERNRFMRSILGKIKQKG